MQEKGVSTLVSVNLIEDEPRQLIGKNIKRSVALWQKERKAFLKDWFQDLQRPETILFLESTLFLADFHAIDDDFYEEIEETLVMGDIGVNATKP